MKEPASVCSTEAVSTVYNLRVADHHTYFVGGSIWGWDVWVHNAPCAPKEAGAFRALRPEDAEAIAAGQRLMPKGSSGKIIDHIKGKDTKYISISMTKGGTAKYHGPDGIAEIDLDVAFATGSGLVPYKQVLQVARKQGTTQDVKNVIAAQEALLTNGIDPRAIIRIVKKGG